MAEILVQANNLTYINAIQHQQQAQTQLQDSVCEHDRLVGEITGLWCIDTNFWLIYAS